MQAPPNYKLSEQLINGDRRALARAITLVESTLPEHRDTASALISSLHSNKENSYSEQAIRIGITGPPGVGKSTFIEALGLHIIKAGYKVGILAVDPSSPVSGGSILGDKTRMEELSKQPNAFIRPSPSGGTLGGVARRTRDVIILCEASGFDVILVETVGVGQSETAVSGLVDMFILLLSPAGGDDLQGIKKGIVELADLIVVNKADGELVAAADRAQSDYSAALGLIRPSLTGWKTRVKQCSSLHNKGIEDIWNTIQIFQKLITESGELKNRRAAQAIDWMWNEVHKTLLDRLHFHNKSKEIIDTLTTSVRKGEISPSKAALQILNAFDNHQLDT